MIDLSKFDEKAGKNILICPNETCIGIPEISYTHEFINSNIIHNCNSCQTEGKKVGKYEISKFLLESSKIRCNICSSQIIHNFFCYYCEKCKNICQNFCDKNHQKNILQINNIYNNCLEHNSPFVSKCIECNLSLCQKCEDENICKLIHHIITFDKISQKPDEIEKKISAFEKQKYYLNKIAEINQDIIQYLKNDINIKEKIIMNYQNNKNIYESILNFNNLKINNNDKYEAILNNIITEYEKAKSNKNLGINTAINQILTPLYFSLMINQNQNSRYSIFKELERIISNNNNDKEKEHINNNNENTNKDILSNDSPQKKCNNNEKNNNHCKGLYQIKYNNRDANSYKLNFNKNMNKKYLWERNNKNAISVSYNHLWQKTNNIKFENKVNSYSYKEIKNLQYNKKINNIILLKSGNMALSSYGMIEIYNNNIIYKNTNKNQLLIRIELNLK